MEITIVLKKIVNLEVKTSTQVWVTGGKALADLSWIPRTHRKSWAWWYTLAVLGLRR